MSSGLRLAASGGKPLSQAGPGEPDLAPAGLAAPAGPLHLARCPACAALNGQSATECWSCETALSPADLILAAPTEPSTDAWASLVELERRLGEAPPLPSPSEDAPSPVDVPVWNVSAPAPTRPGDEVPTLTDAMEHYSFAVTHAQTARRRMRRASIAAGAFGLVALAAFVVYWQMATPALPALDAATIPTDPSSPERPFTSAPLGGVPLIAPEPARPPLTARASPSTATVVAPRQAVPTGKPPAARPRAARAPEAPRPARAAPVATARPESCTAAVVALGLCAAPLTP